MSGAEPNFYDKTGSALSPIVVPIVIITRRDLNKPLSWTCE